MSNVPSKISNVKIRKIKRSKKAKPELYFTKDTQAAIEHYQILTGSFDKPTKDNIYVERIHPAFTKLVENLINIHGFASFYDSVDDLRADCITFLFESIHKFDGTRGTNAFSYFNIVAKHWLIIRSKKKMIKLKKNVSLDDYESINQEDANSIEEYHVIPGQDDIIEKKAEPKNILHLLYKMRNEVRNPDEILCMDSIINLFENIEEIDLLNKSAVLIYLKEMSALSPKRLTISLSAIKKLYREFRGKNLEDEIEQYLIS